MDENYRGPPAGEGVGSLVVESSLSAPTASVLANSHRGTCS